MALPDEVFERAYGGQELTPDENRMFEAHPLTALRLLANIPRLEGVAEMIRRQQRPEAEPTVPADVRQGAHMLNLALELDQRIYRGITPGSALARLKSSGKFDERMLVALENYSPTPAGIEARRLPIRELRSGMTLGQDVFTVEGNLLIFKEGTVLTETWIERLGNFAKTLGVGEPLDVCIPQHPDPNRAPM
jgi:HD domain